MHDMTTSSITLFYNSVGCKFSETVSVVNNNVAHNTFPITTTAMRYFVLSFYISFPREIHTMQWCTISAKVDSNSILFEMLLVIVAISLKDAGLFPYQSAHRKSIL